MSDMYDAPNQEVVRPDGSPPWEEGSGGSGQPEPGPTAQAGGELDGLTKDQLLEVASDRGIDVQSSATKAEVREAIEAG